MDNPLGETSSNNGIPVVKKAPAATPSKINSADKAISSPKQNPVIPNPKSLNPFAPEFEISPFATGTIHTILHTTNTNNRGKAKKLDRRATHLTR